MSSAATENTSPARFPTSSLTDPELIDVPVLPFTVTISFTLTDGVWSATSDHEQLVIPESALAQIKWVLQPPQSDPEIDLRFNDPPLFFPTEQRNAPMVATNSPQTSDKECVVIWSNRDFTRRGIYHYFINVRIGNQDVIHDPTVENDPPI